MVTNYEIHKAHNLALRDHWYTVENMPSLGERAAYLVKWDLYRKALKDLIEAQLHPEVEAAVKELLAPQRPPCDDEHR